MLQHIGSTNICWTHDIATFCRVTRPFQQRVRLARLALGVLVSTESLPGSNKSTTFLKCLRINYCEGQELLSFQRRQMYIFCHCSGFVLYEQESLHIILLGITCGMVTLNLVNGPSTKCIATRRSRLSQVCEEVPRYACITVITRHPSSCPHGRNLHLLSLVKTHQIYLCVTNPALCIVNQWAARSGSPRDDKSSH